MADNQDVRVDHQTDGITVITLNRPEALNAITMAIAVKLFALLEDLAADTDARAVILSGTGDRAFSAGFDIKEMAGFDGDAMRAAFVARDPLPLRIAEHPLPIIAALNGPALGAGALIAAACDFRVACPAASFKVTAIGYGSANASWSLSRLVGPARAKDILMTGRSVQAEEALAIGLYDRIAEHSLEGALALARDIIRHPKLGVGNVKRLVDTSLSTSVREGWETEHATMLKGFDQPNAGGNTVFASFLDVHRDLTAR